MPPSKKYRTDTLPSLIVSYSRQLPSFVPHYFMNQMMNLRIAWEEHISVAHGA